MSRRLIPVLIAAALALGACTSVTPTAVPADPNDSSSASAPAPSGSASATPATCDNATTSFAPDGGLPSPDALPAGSTMAQIRDRGRLIVGVSADTLLLGSRNPISGQIEGFDIDLARAIGQAILGPNATVQLRVITAAQRVPLLESGEIDIVVRNMTMNCDRWTKVNFSAVYYQAGQKILVRKGSDITGLAGLTGRRVCAPAGSTSLSNLQRLAPEAEAVPATNHTGCLVALQQGDVDAITGDDTVLAGLASQDPYAVVLQGDPITAEPYGVAIPKGNVDLARFVNAVLAQRIADGTWQASYDQWLAPTLGAGAPPTPSYGRTS
ncbi:MAG: glutamate ABC transporter substrate-binding protein [Phycicoccus sp.]|nr:glutamate ABC transporter substrate-binding protein [Phycicoccus sp.]